MRKTTAMLVGVDQYEYLRTLSYCSKDATGFAEVLTGKFGAEISEVLCSAKGATESTSKKNIVQAIEVLSKAGLTEEDTLWFYFAGHGYSASGKDYLAASDTRADVPESGISTDDILAALRSSGAGTGILVMDACRLSLGRGSTLFGEQTAELARRTGGIVFFGCSPNEISQELATLGEGHGVFTFAFMEALKTAEIPTATLLDKLVRGHVAKLCSEHNLDKQTPYTTAAPIQKGSVDLLTGKVFLPALGVKKDMIMLIGPSNAGKTTLGQMLATRLGCPHVEMSSFAWQRFNSMTSFSGSIQDFMDTQVWNKGDFDVIAKDMLNANVGHEKVVVCGARRPEEMETIFASEWNVVPLYVFANAKTRYDRFRLTTDANRYFPSYTDFVRKDLREFSWGLAHLANLPRVHFLTNEDEIDFARQAVYLGVERNRIVFPS